MANATRMWSKMAVSTDALGNRTYTDGYQIVDAATREEARTAPGLPVRNEPMEPGSPYLTRNVAISPLSGPRLWLALVEYAVPQNGQFPETPENPLTRPMRWTNQPVYIERPNELDVRRKPKKNSAGDFFPPKNSRYRRRTLYGTRYERFWDLNKSAKFENTTNATVVRLGPVVIQPGEALCEAIEPVGEFEATSDYLLMQYVITVAVAERPPVLQGQQQTSGYPFDHHQLDIGNVGWYFDADTNKYYRGRFCYASGTGTGRLISDADDVQLDGRGSPVQREGQAQIYVRSHNGLVVYEAMDNPNPAEWLVANNDPNQWPTGQKPSTSPFSTEANPMWLFRDVLSVDWTDLFELGYEP